jgi:hypothetical protein
MKMGNVPIGGHSMVRLMVVVHWVSIVSALMLNARPLEQVGTGTVRTRGPAEPIRLTVPWLTGTGIPPPSVAVAPGTTDPTSIVTVTVVGSQAGTKISRVATRSSPSRQPIWHPPVTEHEPMKNPPSARTRGSLATIAIPSVPTRSAHSWPADVPTSSSSSTVQHAIMGGGAGGWQHSSAH